MFEYAFLYLVLFLFGLAAFFWMSAMYITYIRNKKCRELLEEGYQKRARLFLMNRYRMSLEEAEVLINKLTKDERKPRTKVKEGLSSKEYQNQG